jgi:hypothetical protein
MAMPKIIEAAQMWVGLPSEQATWRELQYAIANSNSTLILHFNSLAPVEWCFFRIRWPSRVPRAKANNDFATVRG